MSEISVNEYYSEEDMIFYSSLSESTIYLLGDPDLITLWEDRHSRGGLTAKLMAGKIKILQLIKMVIRT